MLDSIFAAGINSSSTLNLNVLRRMPRLIEKSVASQNLSSRLPFSLGRWVVIRHILYWGKYSTNVQQTFLVTRLFFHLCSFPQFSASSWVQPVHYLTILRLKCSDEVSTYPPCLWGLVNVILLVVRALLWPKRYVTATSDLKGFGIGQLRLLRHVVVP